MPVLTKDFIKVNIKFEVKFSFSWIIEMYENVRIQVFGVVILVLILLCID